MAQLHDLDDESFAALVRDNLLPGSDNRAAWDQLWRLLRQDAELADRAYDLLEVWLDLVEDALTDGGLRVNELKRAQKFRTNLERAWERLDRPAPEPRKASRAGTLINELVLAIRAHREASSAGPSQDANEELWARFDRLGARVFRFDE